MPSLSCCTTKMLKFKAIRQSFFLTLVFYVSVAICADEKTVQNEEFSCQNQYDKPTINRNLAPTKIAAEKSSTTELRCVAEGDGNITFVWSFNSTVIVQGLDIGRYDIRSAQTNDAQWCSVLTVKRVRPEDYGEYTCVARSHLGYDFVKITLLAKGAPEIPKDFKMINETRDSVTLSWTPGFDGGAEQSFRIRYKKTGSAFYFFRETTANATSYQVTGLVPGMEYEFNIAAYNNLGESAFTEETVAIFVKELTTAVFTYTVSDAEKARRAGNRMWLMSSILGGLAFLCTCLGCILCIWRKCSLMTSEIIIPIAQLQRQEEAREDTSSRSLLRTEEKQTSSSSGLQNESQERLAMMEFQQRHRAESKIY